MSQHEAPMTPAHIWREMTAEQRLAAADALWSDADSVPQQAEAVQAIARQLRFRPQSVLKLAPEKRARHLAALRTVSGITGEPRAGRLPPDVASGRCSRHSSTRLGIAHEDGLIAEGARDAPEPAKLREAAAALARRSRQRTSASTC